MKLTLTVFLLYSCVHGGTYLGMIIPAYYEQFIERKVQDRIKEEQDKMKGKLAYCERMCRV